MRYYTNKLSPAFRVVILSLFLLFAQQAFSTFNPGKSIPEVRNSDKPIGKEPVDYVNPMIGTSGARWMLYPGPCLPLGMVKLSPDNTGETHYKLGAGYEYTIKSISGFGMIHSWMMCGFLTMPTMGDIQINAGTVDDPDAGYRSRIQPENIVASPGYFSVPLDDYGIKAELTTTTRTAFQRYTFPAKGSGQILFDMKISEEEPSTIVAASVKKVSDTEIEGYVSRKAGEWNEYTVYFVARVNQPFGSMGGWKGTEIVNTASELKTDLNQDFGAFLKFSLKDNQTVLLKTGISYVSIDQARLNLDTEMKPFGWDFDAVRLNARQVWNNLLSKIKVEGGTETDKMKFYTNLYRAYCSRTIFSDVNGKYTDMCEKIQQVKDPESPVMGCDAFWGSAWNLNQLWSLMTPCIAEDWAKSELELYDKGGWLPDAPGGLEYSSIMVASHQVPLIVNAWQKGIRGFDAQKAYKAMYEIQMNPGRPHECGGYVGNRNLQVYKQMGFVPANQGPVSNTLEYAYDDWCVAQMAKALGKMDDYKYFMQRGQNYRNVFDPSCGYMRPKYAGGPWIEDFSYDKGVGGQGQNFGYGSKDYVEANAWQFSWFVPHDLKGLIGLMGKDEFNRRLEEGFKKSYPYFTTEYVNHGNQPNMEAGWLFNYSGKPWLTQFWVREILDGFYGTDPVNGYHGDEDQGQMGAWYVLSAMGLFEMDGGASVNPVYEISSPLFEKIILQLDPRYFTGKQFTIEAKNSSKVNRYIQSAKLNGKPLNRFWFSHADLVKGGKLELVMGPNPNKQWASACELPVVMDVEPIVTTPYTSNPEKEFDNETLVTLVCDTPGAEIHYTTDGSVPTRQSAVYLKPFSINKTTTVNMIAWRGAQASLPAGAEFKKAEPVKPVLRSEVEAGLAYKYTQGIYRMVNDMLNVVPLKKGIVSTFSLEPREKEQFFSFDYEGYIDIQKEGNYTFYLACNDGGRLFIDNRVLINNDGLHPVVEVPKQIRLTPGLHSISVKYFQEGGMKGLTVSWEGPGIAKQEIPAAVLFHIK